MHSSIALQLMARHTTIEFKRTILHFVVRRRRRLGGRGRVSLAQQNNGNNRNMYCAQHTRQMLGYNTHTHETQKRIKQNDDEILSPVRDYDESLLGCLLSLATATKLRLIYMRVTFFTILHTQTHADTHENARTQRE